MKKKPPLVPRLNFYGITPGLWMNLQLNYEFIRTDREKGEAIRKEVQPMRAA